VTAAVKVEELTRVFNFRRPGRRRLAAADGPRTHQVIALAGIDFSVRPGEVHGLLGPNGAGKTTLVKILSTVLLPTSGRAWVFDHDVRSEVELVRRRIGIVFGGEQGLYGRLTARQNLEYWASLYRLNRGDAVRRTESLLDRLGLGNRADSPVDRLSRGMKQRLHLARGLISNPDLLFLDEPTVGMDPVAAREVRRLVSDLRGDGRTILLTTHDMTEAESLCDRVTMIDRGHLLGTADPREVGGWITSHQRVEADIADAVLEQRLSELPNVGPLERLPDRWLRVHTTAEGAATMALRLLVDAGVTAVRVTLPDLEEVYLRAIGDRGLRL
jgi:ABC-2 type transport system ATP-binding protein